MHLSTVVALTLFPASISAVAPGLRARATSTGNLIGNSNEESSGSLSGSKSSGISLANAQRLEDLCFPSNATGEPDFNAPCNQIELLFEKCLYGGDNSTNSNSTNEYTERTVLGASQQQQCFCKTNDFFQYYGGCNNCYRLHGANITNGILPQPYISMISSSYCTSATVGLGSFLRTWKPASTIAATSAGGNTDVLGTKTDVSQYFTTTSGGAASAGTSSSASGAGRNATSASSGSSGAQAPTRTASGSAAAATNTSAASPITRIGASTLLTVLLMGLGLVE
ncbi:MAG: hypothetical protein M1835_005769 [Candelina submexicana]|nr:MAG: hypothetical protein M1835_005769 [Candelina submexicana]